MKEEFNKTKFTTDKAKKEEKIFELEHSKNAQNNQLGEEHDAAA